MTVGHLGVKADVANLVGHLNLVEITEGTTCALVVLDKTAQVERADDHVLGRSDERTAVGRAQHIVRREHEHTCFSLCLRRQRQVDSHLIAIEVSVEGGADQWVKLDGLTLDQHGLECLDAETVKRRCTVQEHWVLLDDIVEDIPHLRLATLDHTLGRLDVLGYVGVDELLHHEWLEQFERHQLRQATLVQSQRRANHDDRTP